MYVLFTLDTDLESVFKLDNTHIDIPMDIVCLRKKCLCFDLCFFFLWKRFHSIPIFLKTLHVHMYVVVSNFIEPMQNTFLFDKNIGNTIKSAVIVREDILARNAAIARFNSTYFSNVNLVLVQLTFL